MKGYYRFNSGNYGTTHGYQEFCQVINKAEHFEDSWDCECFSTNESKSFMDVIDSADIKEEWIKVSKKEFQKYVILLRLKRTY